VKDSRECGPSFNRRAFLPSAPQKGRLKLTYIQERGTIDIGSIHHRIEVVRAKRTPLQFFAARREEGRDVRSLR